MIGVALQWPVVVAIVFLATVLVVLALSGQITSWIERRRERALDNQRRLFLSGSVFFQVYGPPAVALATLLFCVTAGLSVLGFVVAAIVYYVLDKLPELAIRQRMQRFEHQLVDALTGLANSLKAGLSLPQAVKQVATDMPAPVSQEFGQVMHEYSLGKTIEQAFEDTGDRVRSRNFDLAIAAFRVGKERGGNVAETFEKIADSIREIDRLEEHIKTVTTEGRSSARFMTFMPAVFLVLLYIMDAESTSLLFTDTVGLIILSFVIVFNLIGHFWIQRILAVDV